MGFFRNILSLIGLIALILVAISYESIQPMIKLYQQVDPQTQQFVKENMVKLSEIEPSKLNSYISKAKEFDPKAYDTYLEMAEKLLTTGNSAEASIWKFPVAEDLSTEDVVETMKFIANERNISSVGELPLSKDIEAKLGKTHRHVAIYMFCNSITASKMLAVSDAYSAFLPCRVSLVEDKKGKLWLYSLNMDMMIYGGTPLPKELHKAALTVKDTILDIMKRGALGEF